MWYMRMAARLRPYPSVARDELAVSVAPRLDRNSTYARDVQVMSAWWYIRQLSSGPHYSDIGNFRLSGILALRVTWSTA